jgi:hypothetical protein
MERRAAAILSWLHVGWLSLKQVWACGLASSHQTRHSYVAEFMLQHSPAGCCLPHMHRVAYLLSQTPYGANLLADAVIANYELTGYLQIGNLRLTFQ